MLKRSDIKISFYADKQDNFESCCVRINVFHKIFKTIDEAEKFIDYKIRESLKFAESASEFFSYKSTYKKYDKLNENEVNYVMAKRDISEIEFNEKYIVINTEGNFLPISEKDRLLEWLEYHGIQINLNEEGK